jgi:DNA-binding MltR family transcriptional regulator
MVNEHSEGSQPLESLEKLKSIDWQKVMDAFESVEHLSIRGWVITSVSSLEEKLRDLLKAFFVDDQRIATQMLEDTGPISSFGAQIEIAFLLGLISARERRMLNIIRRIRNDFAHSSKNMTFSHSPIKERCLELDITKDILTGQLCDQRKPDEKFLAALTFLYIVLTYRQAQLMRREEPEPMAEDYIISTSQEILGRPLISSRERTPQRSC